MSWHRDLEGLRGTSLLLPLYIAVAQEIRRSLDDWIPVSRFSEFLELMQRLDLHVEGDCVFEPLTGEVSGLESRAPTTRAQGRPLSKGLDGAAPGSKVHVVVSRRKTWARAARAACWYPVVVKGRVLVKPLVDHVRLGLAFGYPPCCVDFFLRHNDWPRQNTLAEATKATESFHWQANCLAKTTPWMLLYHMPCSFDCPRTVEQSTAIYEAVREIDAKYAAQIRRFLSLAYLSISERAAFAFEGARWRPDGRGLRYRELVNLRTGSGVQEGWEKGYAEDLAAGDEVRLEDGGLLLVLRRGKAIKVLATRCDRGVAEVPVLMRFG